MRHPSPENLRDVPQFKAAWAEKHLRVAIKLIYTLSTIELSYKSILLMLKMYCKDGTSFLRHYAVKNKRKFVMESCQFCLVY